MTTPGAQGLLPARHPPRTSQWRYQLAALACSKYWGNSLTFEGCTPTKEFPPMKTQTSIHSQYHFDDGAAAEAGPAFVAPTRFQHITFTTGHSCDQPREAVPADVSARLSKLIAESLANGGWTSLQRFGFDSHLHVSTFGTTLLAELYLPCKNPQAAEPAIRIGISAGSCSGTDGWKQLRAHALHVAEDVPLNPPAHPWIAAVVDLSALLAIRDINQLAAYMAMMQWAGDFERCLAWAFVNWLETGSPRE
jgi:hypothetical protein